MTSVDNATAPQADVHGTYIANKGDAEWPSFAVSSDAEGAHLLGYVARSAEGWHSFHVGGAEMVGAATREDAIEWLTIQHETMKHVAKRIRAIRPASEVGTHNQWDKGYNEALRQVEQILRSLVGPAPAGEGYTAITHP